jgi:hypothetical protein
MTRTFTALLAAAAAGCLLIAGAAGATASTPLPTPSAGQWTAAAPVPGLALLNVGRVAELNDIACASGGNCAAGGSYTASDGVVEAWVASEVNGSWHAAEEVPGTAAMNRGGYASVEYVSCAAPGECLAVGQAAGQLGGGTTTFAATQEANGGWTAAKSLGPADALFVAAIACPQAGDCVLGGQTGVFPTVRTEDGATWGAPLTLPGIAALSKRDGAALDALACPAPGNCVAAGSYDSPVGDRRGGVYQQAFVASEVHGRWGPAAELPAIGRLNAGGLAQALTISCASAGNCAAGGFYQNADGDTGTFVANEVGGSWRAAMPVPGTGGGNAGGSWLTGLTCTAAATCVAAGQVGRNGFIAQEVGGIWGRVRLVPDLTGFGTSVDQVSCRSAGNCVATGSSQLAAVANGAGAQSFAMTERSGTWSSPALLSLGNGGTTESDALACGPDGACSVGGWIQYGADDQTATYGAYVAGYTPPPWLDEKRLVSAARGVKPRSVQDKEFEFLTQPGARSRS